MRCARTTASSAPTTTAGQSAGTPTARTARATRHADAAARGAGKRMKIDEKAIGISVPDRDARRGRTALDQQRR